MNTPRDVCPRHALPAAILAMAFFAARAAFADGIAVRPPEAPATVFSVSLGAADVALGLQGAWTAGISLGVGFLLPPGLPLRALDSFPGLDQGFLFSQIPDLTVSLSVMEKYFLEMSVLGSFPDNSIRLGYRGDADEVLRSLVIGNREIGIAPSPFLQVPAQPAGSLGAMARLVSAGGTNDLVARWDATARKRKVFLGKSELVEQGIGIDQYERGRYFFLPDAGLDAGSLVVYLEDPQGTYLSSSDGRMYRLAGFDDAVLDSVQGAVSLKSPAKGRVLSYYTKDGAGVGFTTGGSLPRDTGGKRDPAGGTPFGWAMGTYLGADMAARQNSIGGKAALLLWEPGDNSPFEICSSYAFTSDPPADVSRISFRLSPKSAGASPPTGLLFRPVDGERRFFVLASSDFRSTFLNFYPFPDPDGLLYGPRRDSLEGSLEYEIVTQFVTPVNDLVLAQGIVPGSVQVTVNGVSETRFEVDAATGKLVLLRELLPTDRIEAVYRTAEQGLSGGDLLFAWNDRIPLSDAVSLDLSVGFRWNADPWSFSRQPYAKSGTVIAAAAIGEDSENLSWSAQAGAAYTNPDTTGILRLFGMEGHSIDVDLSEENAYPASAPVDGSVFPDPGPAPTRLNRGDLYYRDYRLYGALGSASLQPVDWTSAPPRLPYTDGSRMGPYNVLGSQGNSSPHTLVMEYSLAAGNWAGTQLAIAAGSDVDLSGARAVTLRLRAPNATGSVALYLQVGSISEDLDGSGSLKAESSATDAGFPFVDQAHGSISLRVGAGPQLQGNGRLDSEDRNANSLLDREDPSRIVTVPMPAPGSSWTLVTVPLTDIDRERLRSARGVRIVVKETAGTAAAGEILLDSISFAGTPFWPAPSGSDPRTAVSAEELSETLARIPPADGAPLAARFPDRLRLFHPNGELQEILEVSWSGVTGPFSVKGYASQGTGGIAYDTIVAYIRSPTAGASYSFALLDASGRGVGWSIAAAVFADGSWHEMRVSRADASVRIDGKATGSAPVFDAGAGDLVQLTVDASGTAAGALYLDEVYCTDPRGEVGVALVGELSVRFPGVIVKAGDIPLVSQVSLRQDVSLVSAGFSPLYGIPSPTENLTSRTEVAADVVFSRVSANVQLREAAGALSAAGGHRITVPSVSFPLSLTDAFAVTWQGGVSREDTVEIRPGGSLTASLGARADVDADLAILSQSWLASLGFSPVPSLSVRTGLELSQSLSGFPLLSGWYGERWLRGLSLAIPWEGGVDLERKGKIMISGSLQPAPVGIDLQATAAARGSAYSPAGRSQDNGLELSLGLPFAIGSSGANALRGRISYTRALLLTSAPAPGPRFSTEAAEYARILSLQGYMVSGIPVTEIFTDSSAALVPAWQTAGTGSYAASLSASLQRSYGARLWDLLVPSSAELSMGREMKKAADLTQAIVYVRPKASFHALNLFGKLGVSPVLPQVRTDEYSLNLGASVEGTAGQPMQIREASAEAYAVLQGLDESELTLVNTFRWNARDTAALSNAMQALLDWSVHPQGGVALPFLPAEIGATSWFTHRESAELTLGWRESTAFHPFTLIAGHETTLVFPAHGSLKAGASIGLDAETLGGGAIAWRFALRAALEAKVTF